MEVNQTRLTHRLDVESEEKTVETPSNGMNGNDFNHLDWGHRCFWSRNPESFLCTISLRCPLKTQMKILHRKLDI